MRRALVTSALLTAGILLGRPSGPCLAQTTVKQAQPGFNLFTVAQDVEIGRQSAVEAERQLRLLGDANVDRYLNRVVQKLAAQAPGASYQYQIKAVNANEINAFALPGGPMYVNRGLIAAARNEAELAGVLAHEISHVALRHGTHQASKAYLAQSGLGILGGLLGKSSSTSMLNAIGGVGLNAVFLKFSRSDEYQADQTGAQIMARAGYDPVAMANFFETLRAESGKDPSKLEQFFSAHPPTADREARIRELASSLGGGKTQIVGGFDPIRSRLRGLAPAAPQQAVANAATNDAVATGTAVVKVDAPSTRVVRFEQPGGFFRIDHPDNWRAYPSGLALSLAPEGGVVTSASGGQVMLYGVIVNHYLPFNDQEARRNQSLQRNYAPFEDRNAARGTLEDATDDLVGTILASNSYLRADDGPARSEVIDGAAGFLVLLSGRSPVTGEEERVTVYTRGLPDGHVIYALAVAPGVGYPSLEQAFARMTRTLVVNDEVSHRTARGTKVAKLRSGSGNRQ